MANLKTVDKEEFRDKLRGAVIRYCGDITEGLETFELVMKGFMDDHKTPRHVIVELAMHPIPQVHTVNFLIDVEKRTGYPTRQCLDDMLKGEMSLESSSLGQNYKELLEKTGTQRIGDLKK